MSFLLFLDIILLIQREIFSLRRLTVTTSMRCILHLFVPLTISIMDDFSGVISYILLTLFCEKGHCIHSDKTYYVEQLNKVIDFVTFSLKVKSSVLISFVIVNTQLDLKYS
jgi:hypothetical protein